MIKRWRKKLVICISIVTVLTAGFLVMRRMIPVGLGIRSVTAYWFWSDEKVVLTSPNGTQKLTVVINDAGALQSGNDFTWVIHRYWWGDKVVATGYLPQAGYHEDPADSISIVWTDERSCRMEFLKERDSRSKEKQWVSIHL